VTPEENVHLSCKSTYYWQVKFVVTFHVDHFSLNKLASFKVNYNDDGGGNFLRFKSSKLI
jgi:hypothetical protein